MGLMDLLLTREQEAWRTAKPELLNLLGHIFPEAEWGCEAGIESYTEPNYRNLWANELRRGVRSLLEEQGKNLDDYSRWLGGTHFISVSIWNKRVFDDYKSNTGWRIGLLSLPSIQAIVMGIASHYQGGQQHNQLGRASNLLFDAARQGLEALGLNVPADMRKIEPADWDRTGLLFRDVREVAGVLIPTEVAEHGIQLKDVRTTTVKKILASYIISKPINPAAGDPALSNSLDELKALGSHLAREVYPFRSVDEFEPMRSLALQDLSAASLRLQFRRRSGTRSVVRIYYGPPGTGKTLMAIQEAVKLADPTFSAQGSAEEAVERFNQLRDKVCLVTFHQSLQYEDVIESIRPVVSAPTESDGVSEDEIAEYEDQSGSNQGLQELRYSIYEGPVLSMIRRAAENPQDEFVVVVDEINRGDISRILGPLITALEPDKRVGAEFPLGVELQYPRAGQLESRLYVPSNIHFIGSMNSADRNIALVDHALRRRFDFIEILPQPSMLGATPDDSSIDMRRLLETMNSRIEHLLDRDHCIGHGYFMKCGRNIEVIEQMAKKIIPLLKEYFYGSDGMLLLVLGDKKGGPYNTHLIVEQQASFSDLFNMSQDDAIALGYRPHKLSFTTRLDPRFWNPYRAIPGPDDEQYAAQAIIKIYGDGAGAQRAMGSAGMAADPQ